MKFLRLRMFLVVIGSAHLISLNLLAADRDLIEDIEEFDSQFAENVPPSKFNMVRALREQRRYQRKPYARGKMVNQAILEDDIEEFDSSQPQDQRQVIVIDESSCSDLSEDETPECLGKNDNSASESMVIKLRSQAVLTNSGPSKSSGPSKTLSKSPELWGRK